MSDLTTRRVFHIGHLFPLLMADKTRHFLEHRRLSFMLNLSPFEFGYMQTRRDLTDNRHVPERLWSWVECRLQTGSTFNPPMTKGIIKVSSFPSHVYKNLLPSEVNRRRFHGKESSRYECLLMVAGFFSMRRPKEEDTSSTGTYLSRNLATFGPLTFPAAVCI